MRSRRSGGVSVNQRRKCAIRGTSRSVSRVRPLSVAMLRTAERPFLNSPASFHLRVPRCNSCPYRWRQKDPTGSFPVFCGSPSAPFRMLSPICLARIVPSRDKENPFLDTFRRLAIALRLDGYSQHVVFAGDSLRRRASSIIRQGNEAKKGALNGD